MNHASIIEKLSLNSGVFKELMTGVVKEQYLWKPTPEKWCLLEVICHLYDEEREDFRARIASVLKNPEQPLTSIDPVKWVSERKYMERNFEEMLVKFLDERKESIQWLRSLNDPDWKSAYIHSKFGPISAELLLANWLAHDYLHFRQITRLKYQYLQASIEVSLNYAGEW